MANNLKELLNQPLPRGSSTHAALLAAIGGYLIYMAYQMVCNTLNGESTMSMTTTVILAAVMGLGGLGAVGYGVYLWWGGRKKGEDPADDAREEEK